MELDLAMLADSATLSKEGRIDLRGGGFDTVLVDQFPCVYPQISLVMRFFIHLSESEFPHKIIIRLMDADGRDLVPKFEKEIPPKKRILIGRNIDFNMIANFPKIQFEKPGDYSFEILIDGHHVKSLPLALIQRNTFL